MGPLWVLMGMELLIWIRIPRPTVISLFPVCVLCLRIMIQLVLAGTGSSLLMLFRFNPYTCFNDSVITLIVPSVITLQRLPHLAILFL